MTDVNDEDATREDLRALPLVELPARLAKRVHADARAAFVGRSAVRIFAPVVTVAVVAATIDYLTWTVLFLNALR